MGKGLLVAGSRSFATPPTSHHYANTFRVWGLLGELANLLDLEFDHVISGTARGPDRWGGEWAETEGLAVREMPANWDLYGKSAGYRRNVDMVEACVGAIVLWDGLSAGTQHTIKLLSDTGKPHIVWVNDPQFFMVEQLRLKAE